MSLDGTPPADNVSPASREAVSRTSNGSCEAIVGPVEQPQNACRAEETQKADEPIEGTDCLTGEKDAAQLDATPQPGDRLDAGEAATKVGAPDGVDDRSEPVKLELEESVAEKAEDFLEEEILPSEAPEDPKQLEEGSTVAWGELQCKVVNPLPYGWYEGLDQHGTSVFLRPGSSPFNGMRSHPMLPAVAYAGPEGHIIGSVPGEPIKPGLTLPDAFAILTPLAQLVRFFEAQGFAVIDLDPEEMVDTDEGLRLQRTPRLARIGEELPHVYREGFSPPETQRGQPATGREGVHILGALLYYLLTGQTIPAEGLSNIVLASFRTPGLPQLLARAAQPDARSRSTPQEFSAALKSLQGNSRSVRYGIGAATTIGLNPERLVNEDSYGYTHELIETAEGAHQLIRACVADGMGGEEAGEVASQAAVNAFCRELPPQTAAANEEQAEWTEQLGWAANRAVLSALQGQSGGCTLTGVVIQGNSLTLAHVGDSRAYLYRAMGLERLTRDHSLVSALVANGMMTEDEAKSSPDRSTILRSLGSVKSTQPNYIDRLTATRQEASMTLGPGDVLILCSDGVCGEVEEGRIAEVVRMSRTPDEIASGLIQQAIELGAPDNATALVIMRD